MSRLGLFYPGFVGDYSDVDFLYRAVRWIWAVLFRDLIVRRGRYVVGRDVGGQAWSGGAIGVIDRVFYGVRFFGDVRRLLFVFVFGGANIRRFVVVELLYWVGSSQWAFGEDFGVVLIDFFDRNYYYFGLRAGGVY